MFKKLSLPVVLVTALLMTASLGAMVLKSEAQAGETYWGPEWTETGELVLPRGYHRWVFLGSPLTPHGLNGGNAPFPEFHNVYIRPEVYAIYQATGEWPEGTIMLKELQRVRPGTFEDGSGLEVSGRGFFPGKRNGIDIAVKDSKRFPESNGWGFFNFGHKAPPYAKTAAKQPVEACAACHIANADNMVFSKFYAPVLEARD